MSATFEGSLEKPLARIGVVIPCYGVGTRILEVLAQIGPECDKIYLVDDGCPDRPGDLVKSVTVDKRVNVVVHSGNQGVGAAVKTGYRLALADGMTVIVKIDGDGQMDPSELGRFVAPIISCEADYAKGNRFFDPADLQGMPISRLLGNALLSFLTKLSSGYWTIFDPTNGYTAIDARVLSWLPLEKIDDRFFFESDLLFRLYLMRAKVVDIPMQSKYSDEISNLRVYRVIHEFLWKNLRNTCKRIGYRYFVRDFSTASIELIVGIPLAAFGTVFGLQAWIAGFLRNQPATAGTIMLAALPVILGIQLLISFLSYDIAAAPTEPIGQKLPRRP